VLKLSKLRGPEFKITVAAVLGTIFVTLGFTLSQGETRVDNLFKKNSGQVVNSQQFEVISEQDYKIVSENIIEENGQKRSVYNIFMKDDIRPDQANYLSEVLYKKSVEKDKSIKQAQIYIFKKQNDAKDYSGDISKISKEIIFTKDVDKSYITLKRYSLITKKLENSIPKEFEIKGIKQEENFTKIDMKIPDTLEDAEALYQIEFLIKKIDQLNTDKNLDKVVAIVKPMEGEDTAWEYNSEYKDVIVFSETSIIY
jgi:hypothetical protein